MFTHTRCHNSGFTLIELMLVVAIVGLLSAIAIPKFANMVLRAKEAALMGKLGSLRSAVAIYYANNEGFYPLVQGGAALIEPLVPNYIEKIPTASIPGYAGGTNSIVGSNAIIDAVGHLSDPQTTPWAYFRATSGLIVVNCTHTDSRGNIWSTY
jgi:general secretion pathway protein G